jgi:DNA-binding MarR family transcriptional regulator
VTDADVPPPHGADPLAYAMEQLSKHWPDFDSEAVWATALLLRTSDLVQAQLDATIRDMGVTFARLELLLMLYYSKKRELPMGRISERLMIHRSSVTGAMIRLVELGLVERVQVEGDRRLVIARLTSKGRDVVERAVTPLADIRFGFEGLSREDTIQLARLLAKLRVARGDVVGDPGPLKTADHDHLAV